MKYINYQITFREIPSEVCLSFLISGCPVKCIDCNSKDSWNPNRGTLLDQEHFRNILCSKLSWITCVLFLGGEWNSLELIGLLTSAKEMRLKTALFTGQSDVDDILKSYLDYIKVGPFIKDLGGLDSPRTNQKLINLRTGKEITLFKEDI